MVNLFKEKRFPLIFNNDFLSGRLGKIETHTLILDPVGVQVEKQGAKDVNAVVRAVCLQLDADSPAQVSQLFSELVHSLRKASAKDVKAAWATLKGSQICPESVKTE